jgi:quercetin dioxygenase-like cupin family protein
MQPYALAASDGRTVEYGIPFLIKLGECAHGRGLAIVQYTARSGEEPPEHVHPTEDEVFYVVNGRLTFVCGGEEYPVAMGGMMILPAGSPHTYRLATGEAAQVLAITYPVQSTPDGWNGFVADMEQANSEAVL